MIYPRRPKNRRREKKSLLQTKLKIRKKKQFKKSKNDPGYVVNNKKSFYNSKKKDKSNIKSTDSGKNGENFAWSAFQSPPDASALPLPVFSSFSLSDSKCESQIYQQHGSINIRDSNAEEKKNQTLMENEKTMKESDRFELHGISNTVASEIQIKALLNIRDTDDKASEKTKNVVRESDDSLSSPRCMNLAAHTSNFTSVDKPTSWTLPEATPSLSDSSPDSHLSPNRLDPIAMLMNAQSYGTANHAVAPISYLQPQYSQHAIQQTQSGAYTYHPIVSQNQHGVPYVTVQVRLPPVLMPGRQMVLPASPLTGGYSVPIVVPEGAQPGMVIPVTLEAPLHHSSHDPLSASHSPADYVEMMHFMRSTQSPPFQMHHHLHAQDVYRNNDFGLCPRQHQNIQERIQHQRQYYQDRKANSQIESTWAARAAKSPTVRKIEKKRETNEKNSY